MRTETETFRAHDYLGPFKADPSISKACELAEHVWEAYREFANQYRPLSLASRPNLTLRMMTIAEVSSNAICLNATWGLTSAAMSLVRDRYEQAVRFSYLIRNPDKSIYEIYILGMLERINFLTRKLDAQTLNNIQRKEDRKIPEWATQKPTKDQEKKFREWHKLKLNEMAEKRDTFSPLSDTPLAKESLAKWYYPIYGTFSSVSHYDCLAIQMAKLQQRPDGSRYLAFSDKLPGLLIFYTSFLDMIQCSEAITIEFQKDCRIRFESLFLEWHTLMPEFIK